MKATPPSATIERQRICVEGEVIEDTPKSDAGQRVIPLGSDGVEILKAHRIAQKKERLSWGEAWVDSGKVFTHEDGSPLNPDWVSDEFDRLIEECDLPPVRLHDLRHGAGSIMLAAGVDMKVVQEILGHANLSTTANTYTSVYPEVAAADAVAALVPAQEYYSLGCLYGGCGDTRRHMFLRADTCTGTLSAARQTARGTECGDTCPNPAPRKLSY